MITRIAIIAAALATSTHAVTVFSTGFDYTSDPLLGSGDAVSDLNGATGQIGTWDGTDPLPAADTSSGLGSGNVIGISSDTLLVDRPLSDITMTTTFTDAIALDGAGSYSFDWQFRRSISGSFTKDIDVVGYDDGGTELFHIRLTPTFSVAGSSQRIGVVDGGGAVNFNLPGVAEADGYLDSFTGGSLENVNISLGATGFIISYDGNEGGDDFTSGLISYTGAGSNLAYVSFEDIDGASQGDSDNQAGFFLDNVTAQGTVVPEPSALLLGAVGGLLLLRRRR